MSPETRGCDSVSTGSLLVTSDVGRAIRSRSQRPNLNLHREMISFKVECDESDFCPEPPRGELRIRPDTSDPSKGKVTAALTCELTIQAVIAMTHADCRLVR
jgi:hypothetical protein